MHILLKNFIYMAHFIEKGTFYSFNITLLPSIRKENQLTRLDSTRLGLV